MSNQFLAFNLGAEEYGVALHFVRELRSYEMPTRLQGAQHFVRGVIDLRGRIVPIVDMRLCLGLPPVEVTSHTVTVVIDVRDTLVGIVVDGVADVVDLAPNEVRDAPPVPGGADMSLTGIGTVGGRMLPLLDVAAFLKGRGMVGLASTAGSAERPQEELAFAPVALV